MIQMFDRNDRRSLTFPAVHPCEGISPTTLLDSIITLSHSIASYQSKFFSTQKRNARETIRQIGILLIFFEEIKDHGVILPYSLVLCLSELHTAFQKINFLLQDCTREGARLWMLMKSHFVASQFRTLIRTVATVLDILPLNSVRVSSEVKELVEMVGKQARKAKLELDQDDEDAMRRVILILNQFENKVEPDPSIINRVLDYLDIKNWIHCNREIIFLDEEIGSESLVGSGQREIPLLSSLIGFMSYCRGVLFENLDFGNIDQKERRCNPEILTCLNPEDFRCPISLELMTDPVTVSTGQTYDRVSIEKWLKAGHLICPKTGEKLSSTDLVPNKALHKLIHQFCADIGISLAKSSKNNSDISRTILSGSASASEATKFLAEFLSNRLCRGTNEQKNKAAYEIRLLAKSSIFNGNCLIEAGTLPYLLKLLTSTDSSIQENAIAALLKLSKHANGKKEIIDNGGLKQIISVLKEGLKSEVRQMAAAEIFYLSSVQEYRKLIGETMEAFPALVELLKDGTNCGKKNAVVAIFGLLFYHRNHKRVLATGAVPLLVDLLATSDKADLITDVLAVLATLAESLDGSIKILRTLSLPLIMRFLRSLSSRAGKEYCVSILHSLCNNCEAQVVPVLAKENSLMKSLYSVLTDGTSLAGKRARALIKILHKFNEENSSNLMTNDVSQERFINVR